MSKDIYMHFVNGYISKFLLSLILLSSMKMALSISTLDYVKALEPIIGQNFFGRPINYSLSIIGYNLLSYGL